MSSKNTDLWDALNNRLRSAIYSTAGVPEIRKFVRGWRPLMIDGIEKPAVFTHWGPSSDEIKDTSFNADSFDFSFTIVMEIDEGEDTDYINSIVNLRDKILNALENNSSGNQDRNIGNKLLSQFGISSDEIRCDGTNAILQTRIRVDSIFYQPGAR